MTVGYKFAILNSDGTPSTTYVDMDDMFVSADTFIERGVYAWGQNGYGEIGDNTVIRKSSPVQIGSLTTWKQVSAGSNFNTLAIGINGALWSWGLNNSGQLGDNTVISKSSPVQIGSLTNWKQVSAGSEHTAAIKTDGTLWTWGSNVSGRLGDDTIINKSSPVQIGLLTNWKQVSAGSEHTAAVKTDGTLWTWGRNSNFGQLGDGTIINKSSPIQIGSLTNWKQVSAGSGFTLAVKTDGTLWVWGSNADGRLGDGTIINKSSPIQIGSLTNWKQVSAGGNHTAAIKTDGTLWTWGNNANGRLGDGTIVSKSSPVQIGSLTNWKQVDIGDFAYTSAIKTDGTLWTWGLNTAGQLGDGTIISKSSPVQIGSLTNWKLISGGRYHTAGILQFDGSTSIARTVEYVTLVSNTSSGTTYTFNNVNIGTEDYSRYVVVGVFGHTDNTDELDVSSCSIDGENATLIINSPSSSIMWATALYGKSVPAGSTANVSIGFTFDTGTPPFQCEGSAIAIWTLYNLNSLTATSAGSGTDKAPLSYNAGDIVITVGLPDATTKDVTHATPVVEQFDTVVESPYFRVSGGHGIARSSFSGDQTVTNAVATVGAAFR